MTVTEERCREVLKDVISHVGHPDIVALRWSYLVAAMQQVASEAASPRKSERDAVLEEAAQIAEAGCLVPPDGGSPTDAETAVADESAKRIRALKSTTPQTGSQE